ncbi:MAG: hypothetical protein LBN27_12100 [Prevotellaceae bacterium]|jgi:transcriptional regulator with XRE-family HTH domain|nr:hypothetical protein [Prevotellaceae bacterium]
MKEKKLHIGQIVKNAFEQSRMTKADFARAIGSYSQNLEREFGNEDWYVLKLIKAGKALNYDFSNLLALSAKDPQKTEVMLQIKVGDDKMNDVLKFIEEKKLYEILRQ